MKMKLSPSARERILLLSEEDMVLGFTVFRIRMMMSHRGISFDDVSKVIGCSVSKIRAVLAAKMLTSVDVFVETLDEIEDAVTQITDERGGIPEACCGQSGYQAQVRLLQYDPIVREVFSRVE